jgi:hypothetical protein
VYVAVADVDVNGQPGGVYRWLRLPVQVLLVWIALRSTTETATLKSAHPTDDRRDATKLALS